ncbi:host cell division inhibitor Icd-like protein [Escherichia coli]|nr:host cell division inhibitor Icd-like protein [Escherichia coli]EFO2666920.1 host cell division inhibitor Icd-like protein [Escherichia coli]EFO2683038.1 host cell division inhibitor Icd-like protein [Escherichia coli]EFO2731505.1 host cell division inhibitor Icd-like protein [Escherichia coli]
MCNALTVTKRKSAPLPERLCERITCSTAMFAIWVNFSDKFVQCEGADHRFYSTPEMQNILLQNVVGHTVRKAKNFAGGATDAILSGRQVLINYSCSLALRRWRYSTSRFNAAVTNCPVLSPGIFTASTLFITSCGTLAATVCDFAFTAFVAMLCTPHKKQMQYAGKKISVQHLTCLTPGFKLVFNTLLMQGAETTKPRTVGAVTGLLTTNDNESIEVAMRNHTTHPQGRDSHNLNKYIWRFIALSTAQPRVIHIEATSEQEARQQSPDGCVMVFAARIRQEVEHV